MSVVQQLMPNVDQINLVYLMDNQYLPYGEKTDQWIQDRCQVLVKALEKQYQLDILLVACNTASTIALPEIRQAATIPVVGVVPAVKVAAKLTKNAAIGLLATNATVRRPYVDRLIHDFAPHCRVTRFPSQNMVLWAEAVFLGHAFDEMALKQELENFFGQSLLNHTKQAMDVVVLGCTHFSFLIPYLMKYAPWPVQWIDSAQAVTERLLQVLEKDAGFDLDHSQQKGQLTAVTTKDAWSAEAQRAFQALGFQQFDLANL